MKLSSHANIISDNMERIIRSASASCKGVEPKIRGGCNYTGLSGSELAGALGCLTDPQFLAVSIFGGFHKDGDLCALARFIRTSYTSQAGWFVSGNEAFTRKHNMLLSTVIFDYEKGRVSKTAIIAEHMGISQRAFNKTWRVRYMDIISVLDALVISGIRRIETALQK